jgi:hypothetical protein
MNFQSRLLATQVIIHLASLPIDMPNPHIPTFSLHKLPNAANMLQTISTVRLIESNSNIYY